jgi:predicted DNA-binding WGR domain protein
MFLLIFLIHVQIGCSKRPYLPNTGSKFKVAKERCKENKLTITWGKHSSKCGTKMKTTLVCSVVSPLQQESPNKNETINLYQQRTNPTPSFYIKLINMKNRKK